ncbi:MAG: hypothetical protein KAQ64_00895 [Candidatus Pacebacteria bacterium]|nr:hypothetical protein [Candidatus Paceibacterota bacterium]
MNFENNKGTEGLGEAYASDMGEIGDEKEKSGYDELERAYAKDLGMDENPSSLKEAYAKDLGIEISKERDYEDNENPIETSSFVEFGMEQLGIASEKASAFFGNLVNKGKEKIQEATGVDFESTGTTEETGKVVYGKAKEVFTGAVDSAKGKVQEVKIDLVKRAEKVKTSFFERIIKTKDEYVDKAVKLTAKGAVWGIDRGIEVTDKIVKTYDRVAEAMRDARFEALKNDVEKGKVAEIKLEILKEEIAARENASSMAEAFNNADKLSV